MVTMPSSKLTVLLLLAGSILALPVVAGAHGGDPTLIHACVQHASQQVRIVGPNDLCRQTETAVHWSIAGPQGPQGKRGPNGGTIQGLLTGCATQNFLGTLVYAPGTSFIALAAADGSFAISHVLPGTYSLVVEAPGQAPVMLHGPVVVTDDHITDVGTVTMTDTSSDPHNCGACGTVCPAGNTCTGGTCVPATASCTDAVKNGTETDVDCGGTCSACATGKNCQLGTDCQSGVCTNGVCAAPAGCSPGQTLCGNVCTNTASDTNNCGGCGIVCNLPHALSACVAGNCAISACLPGFLNCDGLASNGCERAAATCQ